MTGLVLSLFPGIGMLDMAFEQAGFCVVRGPDLIWGGDIRRFHPPAGRFDGVIGGPPCQSHSRLRHIVEANGFQTMPCRIPEFERCVAEAAPAWFLMENVPEAPRPVVAGYDATEQMLRDVWVGGETSRLRRFTFGRRRDAALGRFFIRIDALHRPDPEHAVCATAGGRRVPVKLGPGGKPKGNQKRWNGGPLPAELTTRSIASMLRLSGLPADFFDGSPLTAAGQRKAIGNGVPLAMGRAVADAVRRAVAGEERAAA